MHQLTDIAAVVVALAVPLCAWIYARISKARQLETHAAIGQATAAMRTQVIEHIDERLTQTDRRINDLARSLTAVDQRESETRLQLAHLQGRFEEAQAQQARQAGGGS